MEISNIFRQNGMASVNTSKSSNSRNSLKINDSDCAVSLYDYELMGDDFFLEVAHIELRKKFVKRKWPVMAFQFCFHFLFFFCNKSFCII